MALGRRRLWIALALSVAAHAWALVGANWYLPENAEPIATNFDARLTAARREPRKVRAARPAPARAPVAALEPEVVASKTPEPLPASPPTPAPDAPGAVPAVAAAPAETSEPAAAQPPASTFPRRARLGFKLTLGDRGVLIGNAVQTWQSDGKTYRIESHSTSAGLVALFKTVKLSQSSEGVLDDGGLKPRLFRTERDGRVTEEASFNWEAGQLTLKNGDKIRELPLTPGAQDVLSLFYQSALTWRGDATIATNVATGKSFNTYQLTLVGEEWLPTRLGRLATVHLKRITSAGEDGVDIWLGRDLAWLPVRIRFADRKGDIIDQLVDDIEIDGVRPVLPAADKGGNEAPAPGLGTS